MACNGCKHYDVYSVEVDTYDTEVASCNKGKYQARLNIGCEEYEEEVPIRKERKIVLCKDCSHGHKRVYGIACSLYGYTDNGRYPDTPNVVMREDDFCSRAEERSQVDKVALQVMMDWAEKQKEVR